MYERLDIQILVYNTIERTFSSILQVMSLFFANIHYIFIKNGSFFVNKRQYHRKNANINSKHETNQQLSN